MEFAGYLGECSITYRCISGERNRAKWNVSLDLMTQEGTEFEEKWRLQEGCERVWSHEEEELALSSILIKTAAYEFWKSPNSML